MGDIVEKDENGNPVSDLDTGSDIQENSPTEQSGTQAPSPTAVSSSGGIGGSTGQAPATAKQGQLSSAGKRFASLKKFKEKNTGEASTAAISNRLSGQDKSASSDVNKASSLLQANIGTEKAKVDQGQKFVKDDVASNAADFTSNEENLKAYKDLSTDTSFKDLGYDQDRGINTSIEKVEQSGRNLGNEKGRFQELKNTFGRGSRGYNAGQSYMDQLLLQKAGNRDTISGLGKTLGKDARSNYQSSADLKTFANEAIRKDRQGIATELGDQLASATSLAKTKADKTYQDQVALNDAVVKAKEAYQNKTLTKEQAQLLGLHDKGDGTYTDFGADSNLIGSNVNNTTTSNVTSLSDKDQFSGLNELGAGIDSATLSQYGATRNEAGEFVDAAGNIVESGVKGGLVDGGFKSNIESQKQVYETAKQNVKKFNDTVQGGESSMIKDTSSKFSVKSPDGDFFFRTPKDLLGISGDSLDTMSNGQLKDYISKRLPAFQEQRNKVIDNPIANYMGPEDTMALEYMESLVDNYTTTNNINQKALTNIESGFTNVGESNIASSGGTANFTTAPSDDGIVGGSFGGLRG